METRRWEERADLNERGDMFVASGCMALVRMPLFSQSFRKPTLGHAPADTR